MILLYERIGDRMRRIIKHLDKTILIISIILFVVGLIMVFSSSNVTAYMRHAVSPYNYFIKQAVFLLVGIVLALIMIPFNTRFYGFMSNWKTGVWGRRETYLSRCRL